MRTIGYIFLALAALGAAVLFTRPAAAPIAMPSTTATLSIGTTTIVAEIADSDAERAKGLGGRTSLEEGTGMWFVFEEDGLYPFWMKDTLIPLDIIWVAADGTIVTIVHGVKPDSYPQTFGPTAPARYVLEVLGGFAARQGIAEGQRVVVQ